MASAIGKKAAKSIFAKHVAGMEPQDPLYENTTDARGKKKRVRRQLPPGLSKRDRDILAKIKKRAHYLDKGINLCGLRVGWTFWIGLIPGAGDVADAALNYFLVLRPSKKAELPSWLVSQMVGNNVVSAGVGVIPLVGDVLLGIWKANSRNAHLLEEYLAIRGQEYLAELGYVLPGATTAGVTSDPKLKAQYKPGAGLAPGEVVRPPGEEPVKPKGWGRLFGGGGGGGKQGNGNGNGNGSGGSAQGQEGVGTPLPPPERVGTPVDLHAYGASTTTTGGSRTPPQLPSRGNEVQYPATAARR